MVCPAQENELLYVRLPKRKLISSSLIGCVIKTLFFLEKQKITEIDVKDPIEQLMLQEKNFFTQLWDTL